jgi:hypothetical protein
MKGDRIADPRHKLTRFARTGEIDRKASGDPYVTGAAFVWTKVNDQDPGLSVNWLDYFAGTHAEKLTAVRAAMHMTPNASARLALLEVGVTTEFLKDNAKIAISVIEDPTPPNPPRYTQEDPSHAAIVGLPHVTSDPAAAELVGDLIADNCVLESVPAREPRPHKP